MAKSKCKMCNNAVDLRKNDIIVKLDKKTDTMHAYRVTEQKNGFYKLDMISEEKEPLSVRKKVASEVVSLIKDELQEQILKVVEKSLTRRDVGEMEYIRSDVEKGEMPKLKESPGCVYIDTSKGKIFL